MTKKVYVQAGYIIGEATEPYLQIFELWEAPEDVPIEEMVIVDGVIKRYQPEPVEVPVLTSPNIGISLTLGSDVLARVKTRLIGKSFDQVDWKLMSLATMTLSLFNLGSEPEMLSYSLSKLNEYLDATEPKP